MKDPRTTRRRPEWWQIIALIFAFAGLAFALDRQPLPAGMFIILACAWTVVKPFRRRT